LSIFFEHEPTHLDAPVIVDMTIIELLPGPAWAARHEARGIFLTGLGRIERVIKGAVSSQALAVRMPGTTCDVPLRIGASGFVAGILQTDDLGRPYLSAHGGDVHSGKMRPFRSSPRQ
jgi:hypothetical protein